MARVSSILQEFHFSNEIHKPQIIDSISICIKFEVRLMLLRRVTTEHAVERGVQFSAGVEMEAYGDQAAAASNQFFQQV